MVLNKIKKIINISLVLFVKIFSCVYNYSTYSKILNMYNFIYSIWMSNQFKLFGPNSVVCPGLNLIGGDKILIGNNVFIGKGCIINAWEQYKGQKFNPKIEIGNGVSIGEFCHLTSILSIKIGNNVLMGRRILISDNSHGNNSIDDLLKPPQERLLYSKGSVIIDDNVWIGDKVCILAGVHIGENSIIGANAVVTKDIPANSIAAGVPAEIVKIIK